MYTNIIRCKYSRFACTFKQNAITSKLHVSPCPYLCRREEEVLSEGEAQHVEVLATVAEGGQHMREHLAILQVLLVHQHHAIYRPETTRAIRVTSHGYRTIVTYV